MTETALSRAASLRSSSNETVVTGSINAEHAVAGTLREAPLRQHSVPGSIGSMSSVLPSEVSPQSQNSKQSTHTSPPMKQNSLMVPGAGDPRKTRVKSHTAKVSRWSESEAEQQDGTTWSRVPSVAISDVSERSADTRPPSRRPSQLEAVEEVNMRDEDEEGRGRASLAYTTKSSDLQSRDSKSSLTSVMRRLDSVMGQLDLGPGSDGSSSPQPWRLQRQTKSSATSRFTQSGPAPSPGLQSVRGFAL